VNRLGIMIGQNLINGKGLTFKFEDFFSFYFRDEGFLYTIYMSEIKK